jgi:DNA-binding NarL/FixJ family response regulator
MENVIKIALVDDHVLLRDALAEVIGKFEQCKVILLARTGKELIDNIQSDYLPDIILLDINMPELDGYDTASWLRKNYPEIRILILTMYDSEVTIIRLLQQGIRGYLKKDIHPGELLRAIKTTQATGYYYSGETATKLVGLLKNDETNTAALHKVSLPANELRFLELASTEMTYKEIAIAMKVSPRTVDNYRDALFIRLGVKSRVGLVIFAVRNGIVRIE